MTRLEWDKTGEKFYEAGVDRAVLYLENGDAVPWNGLISVNRDLSGFSATPLVFDGVKFGDDITSPDYSATLTAYTYPDEFPELEGVVDFVPGMSMGNQRPSRFGLSYRTGIGNDLNVDAGYKIHVIYNLVAVPTQKNYTTYGETPTPTEFQWVVSAVPIRISGFRPTAHVVFDTRILDPLLIEDIEKLLYGNEDENPSLPTLQTLMSFVKDYRRIRIVDNEDGTWTATSVPDSLITMIDSTTFQITEANAVYLDADTYDISDTNNA